MKKCIVALAFMLAAAASAAAQETRDYTTIEGVLAELYAATTRAPGQAYDWDRFRAIMVPGAILLPQPEDMGGQSRVMSVDSLIAWVDAAWRPIIGTERDRGFFERQTHLLVEQYGDIAHAFSTYEEGPLAPERVQRSGINFIQLARRNGRWYVVSITWAEDNVAGPIPQKFSPRGTGG